MAAISLAKIDVLSEFERCGIEYQYATQTEIKTLCPFHDDNSPSCFVNIEKREFKCQTAGCEKFGDIVTFLACKLQTTRAVMIADLAKRYSLEIETQVVSGQLVERYRLALPNAKPLLKALYDRGVIDADIEYYRLGCDERSGRITIPIPNREGLFVNVRKYMPGAPGPEKMKNLSGHGKTRLFPIEQLKFDTILLAGGEIKAIPAARQLNPHGIGAICATTGEGNWKPELTEELAGKKIYVCMDIDRAGEIASQQHCKRLSRVASWVGILSLPLSTDKYPKGDINDFIGQENGELFPLLAKVEKWQPPSRQSIELLDDDPVDMGLSECIHADSTGKRVRVRAVMSVLDTAPYIIPKTLRIECSREQNECAVCPIFTDEETKVYSVYHESPCILEMIRSHRASHRDALMRGLAIPATCPSAQFFPETYYNCEDARLSPQLEITNRASDRLLQPAICLGLGGELNETYELIGRTWPHPKTQQSTLLVSAYKPTEDALSTYTPNTKELDIFTPRAWTVEGIEEKLAEIYDDFSANVTRIFERPDLHLAVDLSYHSPLLLSFDGETHKGWTEVLIIGDTAQGKSFTANNLRSHYKLGERIECKNATVAGLLGGVQKSGERFFVSWGVIPTHDKRHVTLDELKGASVEIFGKLTAMRDSGIAEIPKIERRRTHARTRLLAISNSRSGRSLASYSFGVEAIRELIGALEDIRRFDLFCLLSRDDIDATHYNQLQQSRPSVKHRFTGQLCRSLILWNWTRKDMQVKFDDDALTECLAAATRLGTEFTDAVPILDRGSARFKIARLAAALAGRTFSAEDDTLVVRLCHIQFVEQFLRRTYSSRVFGYKEYSEAIQATETLVDVQQIKTEIQCTSHPRDLCKNLLHQTRIDLTDLQDWCAADREGAQRMLSLLVRKHAIHRDRAGRAYYKSPAFIAQLKIWLEATNGEGISDRPSHVKEKGKF